MMSIEDWEKGKKALEAAKKACEVDLEDIDLHLAAIEEKVAELKLEVENEKKD